MKPLLAILCLLFLPSCNSLWLSWYRHQGREPFVKSGGADLSKADIPYFEVPLYIHHW